jgi:glutathione S-transferase
MSEEIILYNGPTSPFGRKCKIAALLLDIIHKEEKINIYKSQFLDEFNPLRQVPTLIINKTMISDSDNICLYFDSISQKNSLYPKQRYWDCMTMISVANGIMENAVSRFIEMSAIPENEQRPKAISRYEKKILRSIEWIEKKFDNFISDELTMDQISVACALDYTSFRFTKDWSLSNPKLSKWLEKITENEFMKSTLPGVSFKYE